MSRILSTTPGKIRTLGILRRSFRFPLLFGQRSDKSPEVFRLLKRVHKSLFFNHLIDLIMLKKNIDRGVTRALFLALILVNSAISQEKITFLFYNDFHSQNISFQEDAQVGMSPRVGGAATLAGYINRFRAEFAPNVCLVNAGDDFQGSPSCTITRGQSQIEILNLIRPDVMTLGNHEFDFGRDGIERLLSQSHFPIICANIIDKKQSKVLTPPFLIKQIGGVRVGFIGLLTPRMELLTLPENIDGYIFLDPEATFMENLPALQNQTDLIVLVSHLGDQADVKLAKNLEGFQIIFGAHTHKTLIKPLIENDVIICQAGSRGSYLGVLEVWVDRAARKITKYKMRLVNTFTDEIEPDSLVLRKVNEIEAPIQQQLSEVIGQLKTPWIRKSGRGESNIANWIADAIRDYAQSDVAFINDSGIRKDLPPGNITLRDIWEIEPFSNTITQFRVSGNELKQILEAIHSSRGSFLVPSGIRYQWILAGTSGNRTQNILVNGKPLDLNATFTISTNNFLTGETKFEKTFGLEYGTHEIIQTAKLVRDVLIEKVRQEKVIYSKTDQRIQEIYGN
jgi:5'-nucleotidase/2',3'-cyclic-nucleotide 2'-phosphodiesterase/3'-nucleotidase